MTANYSKIFEAACARRRPRFCHVQRRKVYIHININICSGWKKGGYVYVGGRSIHKQMIENRQPAEEWESRGLEGLRLGCNKCTVELR